MEIPEFKERLSACRAAYFDVDRTLVDGNVSGGIGKRYLKKALQEHDYSSAAIGFTGGLVTLLYTDVFHNDQHALEKFIGSLNLAECADESTTMDFAADYIKKHQMPGVKDFIAYLKSRGLFTVAYTGGLDVSSYAAKEELEMDDSFGNYSFEGKKIVPSSLGKRVTGKPIKYLTALRFMVDHRYSPESALVIGDSDTDLELMHETGLTLASPLARPEVKEAADLWIPNYEVLVTALSK